MTTRTMALAGQQQARSSRRAGQALAGMTSPGSWLTAPPLLLAGGWGNLAFM